MNILTVEHISKTYKPVKALWDVSFEVPAGCVFGILGPNGSGKTTMLGIVTDVIRADSGTYRFFEDGITLPHLLRRRIGTLLETPNFFHYLSARDNLGITCQSKGADQADIDTVLKKVGLYQRRNSRFSTYSLGMKQRLGIAAALLGDPELLILDELTNGLDPEGIAEIRNLIKELGASGHTILMASHLLDEVEKVCTHVAILKSGRLLAAGKADEIMAEGDIVELGADDPARLHSVLLDKFPGRKVVREGETVLLYLPADSADMAAVNSACYGEGVILARLLLKKKSMESMFLEIVSNPGEKR